MRKKDLIEIWQDEGDLDRMNAFFKIMNADSEVKERIRQKALSKISNPENDPDQSELNNSWRGMPVEEEGGLLRRIRGKFQGLTGRSKWKLAISITGLAFLVMIGQSAFNPNWNLLPRMGSHASDQATSAMSNSTNPSYGMQANSTDKNTTKSQGVIDSAVKAGAAPSIANESADRSSAAILPVPPVQIQPPPADAALPRKITHDLSMTLQVTSINQALSQITQGVQQRGGYVAESQQNGWENNATAHLTIKVPADKLSDLQDSFSGWGKVLEQHTVANDISNQYYDAQARLQALEAEEKRYLEILNQAKTVDDVLKVENALGNIRQQIEQLKGQLKLWNHLVDYSTVTIQLVPTQTPNISVKNPWQPISWSKTWKATQDAVLKTVSSTWNGLNYLIIGIGYALPFLLVGVLGWGGVRVWKHRKR